MGVLRIDKGSPGAAHIGTSIHKYDSCYGTDILKGYIFSLCDMCQIPIGQELKELRIYIDFFHFYLFEH